MRKNILKLKKHKKYALILAVAALFIDQVSKALIAAFMPKTAVTTVVPFLIDFMYYENRGAAFGWFSEQRWIFLIATTIFLAIAIYAFFSMKLEQKLVNYALMLIISGGIGNMIDRIFRGYVIDFINMKFLNPIIFFVFNIADCCVVIGCVLFILFLILDSLKVNKVLVHKHVRPSDKRER